MTDRKLKIAIIGAGGRGLGTFGQYIAEHAPHVEVVAVADPDPKRRELARRMFPNISDEMLFDDWRPLLAKGKIADGVIIATMEDIHIDIAPACAKLGYDILMEKPMAPSEQQCRDIVRQVKAAGVIFSICHELRYAPFFQTIRSIIESGEIGDITHVQHFEDIAYWHFTHSFVRGYYRNSVETSFSLLSKSCHDIDILRYLIGRPCRRVHSFGGLIHFKKECKPAAAGDAMRCNECAYEPQCPYSALKIYIRDRLEKNRDGWMVSWLREGKTAEQAMEILRDSVLGRCVYECDNDVADHQVVNLEYEGGVTAGFAMTGFMDEARRTVVEGTRGFIRSDMKKGEVRVMDFLTDTWREVSLGRAEGTIDDGHGGADPLLMAQWLAAIANRDPSQIITGPDETLETHITTFAAERSRLNGTVEVIEY